MIWFDVDTAIAECPVNIMPLIDDTDFKSIEAAVAYNASGMALFWNFVTCAGAFTQTAVTPANTGNYLWTDQGTAGFYTIQIPASGGASINNDTEGFGWFTGVCTGVLPWRGPVIGFRAAGLNDKMVESAYDTTRGLAGTALPAAAAEASGGLYTRGTGAGQINQDGNGRIDTNVAAISTDTTAADNLEAACDGNTYNVGGGAVVAASVTGAVGSVTGAVGGNVTGSIGSLATQAKADVNAEVLDVLNTDTFSEPGQGDPPATATLIQKIGYLYKNWRNKKTQTSSEWALYNDDTTTKGQKATVSDDGTTTTKGEVGTGA